MSAHLTLEDHIIFARLMSVSSQARYHLADWVDARAMMAIEVAKERAHRLGESGLSVLDYADVSGVRADIEAIHGEPLL